MPISRKQKIIILICLPAALFALLYAGGFVSQFFCNYKVWQEAGGEFGSAPEFPDPGFFVCLGAVFRFPYGLYGIGGVTGMLALLIFMVMRMGYSENGTYDRDRKPDLNRYAFSTIAWRSMKQSVAAFQRAELRRRDTERRYLEAAPRAPDPLEEMEARLILHELASVSTPEQRQLAALRLQGYTIAETACLGHVTPKRAGKLLREMYRVYLELYKN